MDTVDDYAIQRAKHEIKDVYTLSECEVVDKNQNQETG